jgi:hypothetical protein
MAIIKSGATSDLLTIDPISKAARATLYDATGREVSPQSKATYAAAATFTPPATPTDIISINGSATKNVRVISVYVTTTTTAAGSIQLYLAKRSANNTGGAFVPVAGVPFDSTDPAATANVGHWTTTPAVGALVGNTNIVRLATPVAVPATFAGIVEEAGKEIMPWMSNSLLDKPITLRGVTQGLGVHFAGAALVAGQTHAYRIVWIED